MGVVKWQGVGGAKAALTSPGVVEALLLSALMGAAGKGVWVYYGFFFFFCIFPKCHRCKTFYS